MDKLLTKTEVCELLQISRPTLDRIVAAGEIEVLRIGGQVRFSQQELLRYLGRCREQKAPARLVDVKKEPARRGRPRGSKTHKPVQEYYPGMKVV